MTYHCSVCGKGFKNYRACRIHEEKGRREGTCKHPMKNITIYMPDLYDDNIQKLIKLKMISSRSEAIRTAVKEFINKEFNENLELLGMF